ncbi:EamA family transporter [Hyphomicrobium sulfonivorans]|uniref:EamA family transporter n=1 Tax=Hyphomicrobium sulfonivorans TaxID=121290 RepID=UPI00156F0A89|nr:EamA family transporter [Hyphomicrobium sulfonivorans]MBI1650486.1 EamA family transporter [Hyphomicrobium sulfonivorans]NSL72155.1 EamA family transporter [Hyphomicrobium sulfonivorans]
MPAKPLSLRDGLLALAVMAVWGSNFVVIRMGLDDLPPLLFAALRFTFVVFPAILFLKRPPVPWRNLAAYGLFIGAGQFGLLFLAMRGSITPGLASLVIQLQAFFTIGIAAAMTGEKVRPFQIAALLLAASGIGIILSHTDGSTTPLGLALVLSAALSWAIGNIVVRATPGVNMLAYVVWGSIFSAPPLYLMSLIFEGVPAIREGLANADINTAAVIAYQAIGNSLFGYAIWGWLLSRYPAATIAPMSLLVPVFGIAASALWLAEPLQDWKLGAAALVMAGLCLNVLWPRFAAIRGARTPPAA